MILKETILSAFTERGTLLKWLKKVESALNDNVLTDISVDQIDATHVKLKFTFENGTSVVSPVLTLPRGDKGEIGPRGPEGIAGSIAVGTVTTGAAGTNARVTNVGNENRAVLNFVIPRGNPGVGFDDAEGIAINEGAVSVVSSDNGVNIEAIIEVDADNEIFQIPSVMYLPLKGSESIAIDVGESGEFIDVHLGADIAAKLDRVLLSPMSAPASVSLVAVDTTNAQTMLTLGSGFTVSDGMLSASGDIGQYSCMVDSIGGLIIHNGKLTYADDIASDEYLNDKVIAIFTNSIFEVVLISGKVFIEGVGLLTGGSAFPDGSHIAWLCSDIEIRVDR